MLRDAAHCAHGAHAARNSFCTVLVKPERFEIYSCRTSAKYNHITSVKYDYIINEKYDYTIGVEYSCIII